MVDKTVCNAAVLVEKNHPLIAFGLSPKHALIQGLCNAEVFSILNKLKAKRLRSLAQRAEILDMGTIVDDNKPLYLGENTGNILNHLGTGLIGDNHRTYNVFTHL